MSIKDMFKNKSLKLFLMLTFPKSIEAAAHTTAALLFIT